MSNSRGKDPGPIPKRWLRCPRKSGNLIADKFLAFKTPLDSRYDDQVPEQYRFPPQMLFLNMKSYKVELKLWIDLTNTNRFYSEKEIEANNCRFLKIACQGHGATPSVEQTRLFIDICDKFVSKYPLQKIGVHCTHGFNRTGFLICSYLVEKMDFSVGAALSAFAQARSPGIYKGDYIKELFSRYEDIMDAIPPPQLPFWHTEEEDVSDSHHKVDITERSVNRRRERNKKNPEFMEGIGGVTPITEQPLLRNIQNRIQSLCNWEQSGFPGCQPVSMDLNNIHKLSEKPYKVSWKADGTRYMMLIDGLNKIYFADRDNSIFKVDNLKLFCRKTNEHLTATLLDGEMVIDRVGSKSFPRYLIYDIIKFNNKPVGHTVFSTRAYCIKKEITDPYTEAKINGLIKPEDEHFGIRAKEFYDIHFAANLVSDKFCKQLSHEPDGLIFQPRDDIYVCGQSDEVLKWKPETHNSIDFRLKIVKVDQLGMIPHKIGHLFVGNNCHFDSMKVSKAMKDLDNKIIECTYDKTKNAWVFMRERTDKSFPNSQKTAESVAASIKNPVTKEYLLEYIKRNAFDPSKLLSSKSDAEMMPPPPKMRRM